MSSFPKLPGYTFLELLGHGTFGRVYKAFRKNNPRDFVAIKCIPRHILTPKVMENLMTEIKLLRDLEHENIVRMLDLQWDSEYVYIILEYCSGGDLQALIRQRRTLPEPFVRRCLQQLAQAMQYLQSKGVVHMDLKPQNILLSSPTNPTLKIADFGVSQYLDHSTIGQDMRGSPLYMAPEMFRDAKYSPKCDLWSLGVILYECLVGHAPFASTSYQSLVQKLLSDKPVDIPTHMDLSEDCCDLLKGLLRRRPHERMSHAQFFTHPFVDLPHAPNKDSLEKAITILKEAKRLEVAGQDSVAYKKYIDALSHLLAALHYEKEDAKKEEIRRLVNEFMTRAEELSKSLSVGGSSRNVVTEKTRMDELKGLCGSGPMKEVSECLCQFYRLIDEKNSQKALKHFTESFPKIHVLVQSDTNQSRKNKLHSELEQALTTAENLKTEHTSRRALQANKRERNMPIALAERRSTRRHS